MDINTNEGAPQRIIRKPAVIKRTGLCDSTIDNREEANDFPTRVSLGGRSVGWVESEIDEWILGKIQDSRA